MSDFSQMPGMGPMNDTLKFMRELWSGVKMPGVSLPSLSLEDIDKQIADLKAVEGWLALNMHMLKATIQTLEVQRATLSALQSMGQNVGATMGQSMEKAVDAAMSAAGAMAAGMPGMAGMAGMAGMPGMGGMPGMAGMPGVNTPTAGTTTAPEAPSAADRGMAQGGNAAGPDAGKGAGSGSGNGAAHGRGNGAHGADFSFATPQAEKPVPPVSEDEPVADETAAPATAAAGIGAVPFVDPAAWWGLLQDQFKHAMESAAGAIEPPASAPAKAGKASASKTASKSAKPGMRKAAAKKTAAKKPAAKKAVATKSAAKKTVAKKAAPRKASSASKPRR